MSSDALAFQFERGALHFPALGLWFDAHHRVGVEEAVVVSHAHSDHIAAHARVLCSPATQALMRARLAGKRSEIVLELRRRYTHSELGFQGPEFFLTLLPAGHILGSAMARLEANGKSLLYTGDFKLQRGLTAEPCEPCSADTLIMETTFGRPNYVFPPAAETFAQIIQFCHATLAQGLTPLLLGYSLGKAQELLAGLAPAQLPILVSEPIARLTQIYQSFGVGFPAYQPLNDELVAGHIILASPGSAFAEQHRKSGRTRVAMVTGWALDPSCRYRYRADAAFPLSDHADFPGLIEFVRRVGPKQVYTLHGFAAEFANHLHSRGIPARPLPEPAQLELALS